jgi:ArsR family transcriptional regulator
VARCDYICAHPEVISAVTEQMPGEELLYDLAELYKIFGDSTRNKILYVLLEAEMCVCDIAQLLNMSQSAISHQLRVLKQSRLVKFAGTEKRFYTLWQTATSEPLSARVWSIMQE